MSRTPVKAVGWTLTLAGTAGVYKEIADNGVPRFSWDRWWPRTVGNGSGLVFYSSLLITGVSALAYSRGFPFIAIVILPGLTFGNTDRSNAIDLYGSHFNGPSSRPGSSSD